MVRGPDGAVKMGCQDPGSAALSFGDACSDDTRTLDIIEPNLLCDTDLCLDGTCSKYCETDTDCGSGYQCVDNIVAAREGMTAKHCLKGATCTLSSDCLSGEICTPSATGSGFVNRCVPAYGSVASGGACDSTVGYKQEVSCMDDTACEGTWSATEPTIAAPRHQPNVVRITWAHVSVWVTVPPRVRAIVTAPLTALSFARVFQVPMTTIILGTRAMIL